MIKRENSAIDYFLVFLLIANSGMPFFTGNPYFIVVSLVFTLFFVKNPSLKASRFFIFTIAILTILIAGQTITTGVFEIRTAASLYIRWIYPFVVLLVVKKNISYLLVKVMYILTITTFIFYIPQLLIPGFEDFLYSISDAIVTIFPTAKFGDSRYSNIIIFTVRNTMHEDLIGFIRNSGPFNEPGKFGGFLLLAIVLSVLSGEKIFCKRNILFMIAGITTLSTATIIALFLLIIFHTIFIQGKKLISILFVPLSIFIAMLAYSDLQFLSKRIDRSIYGLNSLDNAQYEKRSRVVSAIVDLETFSQYPIFGTGRASESRFNSEENSDSELSHRNNGTTDFLVKYGLLFFIYYFWRTKKGFDRIGVGKVNKARLISFIGLVCILVLGFSQMLFQSSTFIALYYLPSFIPSKNETIIDSNSNL